MSEDNEQTLPTDAKAKAKAKREVPPQLRPGFRSPAQQARLVAADQAAWGSLAQLRFASPLALQRMHYMPEQLGFSIGEHGFKGRAQRHVAKGYWVSHRLGSRPESVVSLTKRGAELVESTYGIAVPTWNVDSARRGWLRSMAWANLETAGWQLETSINNLKKYAEQMKEAAEKIGQLPPSDARDAFVAMLRKVLDGEMPVATYDYAKKGKERVILLVEDPHKSVESQIGTLKALRGGMGPTWCNAVIYRPVDELSAWNPSKHDWVRRSGRLAKAQSLLREAGFVLDEAPHVPHMQTEGI
jgi:hypothetical protein